MDRNPDRGGPIQEPKPRVRTVRPAGAGPAGFLTGGYAVTQNASFLTGFYGNNPDPPKQIGPTKYHCPPVRKTPMTAKDDTYTHTNHPKEWRVLSTPIVAIATNTATAASPVHHTPPGKSISITMMASWCAAPIIPKPATASHAYDFILDKKEGVGDKSIHIVEENSTYVVLIVW